MRVEDQNMNARARSSACVDHPRYLELLAEAQGEAQPLPRPADGCALCAANRDRFEHTAAMLRQIGEVTQRPLLTPNWQANVWIRLAEDAGVDLDAPFEAPDAPKGRGEDAKIVAFPHSLTLDTSSSTRSRRRTWRWQMAWVAGLLLVASAGVAIVYGVSDAPPTPAAPASAMRGDLPVQLPNPPVPRSELEPVAGPLEVALKAYVMPSSPQEDDSAVNPLEDGSEIPSSAQLSFDYSASDVRYLTVVALVRSTDAQSRSIPEGKQLLWLVDSQPIEDTKGKLNLLAESDIPVDAPPGEMTIYGLFSKDPLEESAVQNAVLLQSAGANALSVRDGKIGVARLELKVKE